MAEPAIAIRQPVAYLCSKSRSHGHGTQAKPYLVQHLVQATGDILPPTLVTMTTHLPDTYPSSNVPIII